MTLIHLHSDRRALGSTLYEPQFSLSSYCKSMKIISHHISDGNIPWIWSAVSEIYMEGAVTQTTQAKSLSAYATIFDPDKTVAAAMFQTQVRTWLDFPNATVTYDSITDSFTITFVDENANVYWADPFTTANAVFGEYINQLNVASITISAAHVGRPYYMLLDVTQARNHTVNTAGFTTKGYHTTILHSSDTNFSEDIINFVPITNTLDLKWYRSNIPESVCPLTNSYEIVADAVVTRDF